MGEVLVMATEGELIVRFRSFCLAGAGREAREGELLVLATEGELIVRFRSFCCAGAGRETRKGELPVLATKGGLLLLNGNGNRLALLRSAFWRS